MDSLMLRIRELDPQRFELLCFQVMAAKYPGSGVRHVEGSSGDEGADLFMGSLRNEPVIWQCKSFSVSMIGKSQRGQIKHSLKRALENHNPKYWILCTNLDFDVAARRWFERLQDSYLAKFGVILDLVQASDLMLDLIYCHAIRDYFFPNAAMNIAELRRIVTKTEGLTQTELATLTVERAREMIDRLEARDPRISYELTFVGNRGPSVFPPRPQPGQMAALSDGNMLIRAFARDETALRLDPHRIQIELAPDVRHRFRELTETGQRQVFRGDEIASFETTFPLFSEWAINPKALQLEISSQIDDTPIPLRVTLRKDIEAVHYDYLDFRTLRRGEKEIEIATIDASAHYAFRFVLPTSSGTDRGHAHFRYDGLRSLDIKTVKQIVDTLHLMQQGCDVELYSLKLGVGLGILRTHPLEEQFPAWFLRLVADMAAVSEKFAVELKLPREGQIDDQNIDTLLLLTALIKGGTVPLSSLAVRLVKDHLNAKLFADYVRSPRAMRMEHEFMKATLFGQRITTGPFAIQVDQLEFQDPDETVRRFELADPGDVVEFKVKPLVPVKYELLERVSKA